MRQSLLEHSESLMSKIVLSNTFEVQEPYTEKALQEMAIATKKQITTHETLSLEVMKDTSFEEIVEEVLLICQKNGLRGEYIGEGVIYGYSAGEVLSYGITLTLYEGMQHNVLLLSVAQY